MVFKSAISPDKKAYLLYAVTDKQKSWQEMCSKLHISKASFYRLLKKGFKKEQHVPKRLSPGGRPRKLSARDVRKLIRCLKKLRREEGNFSSRRIVEVANLNQKMVSNRTVRRTLHEHGYKFLQARKKGVLTARDLVTRLTFARKIKRQYSKELWTEHINFYLDGVSFVYKTNPAGQARSPSGRIWRKPSEGLEFGCTAKGAKEGTGGKVLKLIVAISYKKGVIDCEPYVHMDGSFFQSYVRRKFPRMFEKADKSPSRLWIQDGDPSQNSSAAKMAFHELNATLLSIPPRSPDINPIENVFHIVRKQLMQQAIDGNITTETYNQFTERVIATVNAVSIETINKTIESLDRRMDIIIKEKGKRTKY